MWKIANDACIPARVMLCCIFYVYHLNLLLLLKFHVNGMRYGNVDIPIMYEYISSQILKSFTV